MKFRFNEKELREVIGDQNERANLEFIRAILVERQGDLNVYGLLYRALKHAEAYITNERDNKKI